MDSIIPITALVGIIMLGFGGVLPIVPVIMKF